VKIFFATAFLVFLITVEISAFDTEEQAYVHVERVSWCVKPEHRKNGLLYIHRSPDCEYKTLYGSKTIRDICEISAPEGWVKVTIHGKEDQRFQYQPKDAHQDDPNPVIDGRCEIEGEMHDRNTSCPAHSGDTPNINPSIGPKKRPIA